MRTLFILAAALAAAAPAADAATVRYNLTGSLVNSCTITVAEEAGICGDYLGHSFDGSIRIDESRLSTGSLRSQSLTWTIRDTGNGLEFDGENIAALDVQLPFSTARSMPVSFYEPVNVGSEFTIRTDANRNPIFWSIDIFNDGPDLYFGRSQLAGGGFLTIDYPGIVDSKSVTFGGTPGNLTMAPIPLPPAGLLLLAAIAGAASLRRRRPSA